MIFATALANKKIRASLCSFLPDFSWQSVTAKKLVSFFTAPRPEGYTYHEAELLAFLSNSSIEEERNQIVKLAGEYAQMKEESQIHSVLQSFNEFYNKKRLQEILEEGKHDSEWIIRQIAEIRKINTTSIPIDRVGDLDLKEVIERELGSSEPIPTSFSFLRKAMPWKGYLRGQVVLVCAPPGAGKSSFLANEVVHMLKTGFRIYWLALGDMMKYDFIIRLSSLITKTPLSEVSQQPYKYFNDEVRHLTKNLRMSVLPAGQVDAYEVKSYIDNYVSPEEDIDVFVLDYDSNLLQRGESMYLSGDTIYNTLSQIARPEGKTYRLVFVASQPKIQYWEFAELPKEAAGESSRKQAIVDGMITIGKSSEHKDNHMGVMKIAKLRRGKEGLRTYYILNDTGLFEEIKKEDYDRMRTNDGRVRSPAKKYS